MWRDIRMSTPKRKTLLLDDGNLKELARRRRQSESAVVRDLVAHALAAEEIIEALQGLHDAGGVEDVFGRLPADADTEEADWWPELKFPTPAS
jgi:hypothetical protein